MVVVKPKSEKLLKLMECIEEGSSYMQENTMVLWDKVKHVKREIESGYITALHSHFYKVIQTEVKKVRHK